MSSSNNYSYKYCGKLEPTTDREYFIAEVHSKEKFEKHLILENISLNDELAEYLIILDIAYKYYEKLLK